MGRTALITGAWNGIGLELARLFATQGYDLALVARSEGKLSALSEELRGRHGITPHVILMDLATDAPPMRSSPRCRGEDRHRRARE